MTIDHKTPQIHSKRTRVLFARNPPDAFDDSSLPDDASDVGVPISRMILTHITEYLHYKIEPIIANANVGELNWGSYNNGSWNGVLEFIANGTVDTACLFYQRTGLRAKHFAFSYLITNVKPTYVVHSRTDDLSSAIWNAFAPYASSTWITMGVMLMVQTIYSMFVTHVEVKIGRRKRFASFQIVWKFIRLQLYQPDHFDFVTRAGNFAVLVFTIMQCRLLLDMYQTLLLSALLQSSSKNPFTDARDMIKLVASKRYRLITNYIGNWYFEELHTSNVSHYRSLRLATANNPVRVASSVTSALDNVGAGSYIFPIQQDSLPMQLALRRCNLVFVSDGLPEMSSHFIFSPNSVVSLFGVIFVMMIGLMLSLIVFGMELYYAWQFRMFQVRLRTRRAMAEPVHLMALARLFAGPEIQQKLDEQFERPTLPELQAHFGELYI